MTRDKGEASDTSDQADPTETVEAADAAPASGHNHRRLEPDSAWVPRGEPAPEQRTASWGEPFEDDDATQEITQRLPNQRLRGAARAAIPTVRVVAGRDMLRFVTLGLGEEILIGRDEAADLPLTDATVSKRHATIACDEDGNVVLKDLGSTNGTAVNGRPVGRALLRSGDHVDLADVALRLDLLTIEELRHLGRVVSRLESASRDSLTGLLNRRYLDDELPGLVSRCELRGTPIAAAFADIDHFKLVNDAHGHQVGDEVLEAVSRLIMLGVRDTDPCVRYGGEEVLVILPGSQGVTAQLVADRIRRHVFGHDWSRTAEGLQITVSFGVAERMTDEPIREWIQRADRALYLAKRGGRNRVERDGGPH